MLSNVRATSAADVYAMCVSEVAALMDSVSDIDTGTAAATAAARQEALLECVTKQLLAQNADNLRFSRNIYLVYSAALVFFMQAGFAMLCAGAVRKKNVQNTMLKNLLDACGASLAFFFVGYAFAFGEKGGSFISYSNFFLQGVDDLAFWLFQYAFSAASATIVAGTLAERCQMAAYLCYSCMLSGFVYPIIAHAIWSPLGFLSVASDRPLLGVGVVDFAGGGVVHLTGGSTALFATMILGPRRGRFHDESGHRLETPKEFPGHSIALQTLGTFILWFGWYGFNAGSAIIANTPFKDELVALVGVNTTLSGGMAGLVALFLNLYLLERRTGEPFFDLRVAMNGCLGGLVAITAGCGVVEPWAALVIGAGAGLLYLGSSWLLVRLHLDDAVDAIPVHMFNGIWGMLSVGLLAAPRRLEMAHNMESKHVGLFYSFSNASADANLLAAQVIGILFILAWVLGIMLPFFVWLDWRGWFRSDPLEEIVGLDTSYHGGLVLRSEEVISPEYISQFRKQREELRNRRRSGLNRSDSEDGMIEETVLEEQC